MEIAWNCFIKFYMAKLDKKSCSGAEHISRVFRVLSLQNFKGSLFFSLFHKSFKDKLFSRYNLHLLDNMYCKSYVWLIWPPWTCSYSSASKAVLCVSLRSSSVDPSEWLEQVEIELFWTFGGWVSSHLKSIKKTLSLTPSASSHLHLKSQRHLRRRPFIAPWWPVVFDQLCLCFQSVQNNFYFPKKRSHFSSKFFKSLQSFWTSLGKNFVWKFRLRNLRECSAVKCANQSWQISPKSLNWKPIRLREENSFRRSGSSSETREIFQLQFTLSQTFVCEIENDSKKNRMTKKGQKEKWVSHKQILEAILQFDKLVLLI